jgi:acylphosphatase
MEQKRLELRITGIVQGVAFRYYTQDEGTQLALTGFVRNLHDGSVEVVAEGLEPALEELATWCGHGPPSAQVLEVQRRWRPATGEFKRFFIAH